MNYQNENLIKWEKWIDPFDNIEEDTDISEDPVYIDDDENVDQNLSPKFIAQNKPVRVLATPMGIIPMNEYTASGKIFNFWVGHSNFNITHNVAKIIEETDGVESLDIFTRYRFRISIGKAFTDSIVMRDINSKIYEFLDHDER